MRIAHLSAVPFALRLRAPLRLAGGTLTRRCGILVEITDADGRRGCGEAALPVETTPAAASAMAAQLTAITARALELDALSAQVAPPLRAALEMAALELTARRRDISVAAVLGTPRHTAIPVNALVGRLPPAETASAAAAAVAAGFACVKIKIDPRDGPTALAALRAARDALGAAVAMRVDVNAGWSADDAADFLARAEDLDLEYVEQPVASLAEMRRLRTRVAVPLAADELIDGPEAVRAVAAAGAADVVVIKPTRIGLRSAAAAVAAARDNGLAAVLSSNLDSGVGIAAALQLATLLPEPARACGLATAALWERDLVENPPLAVDGSIPVPCGAGLGVAIDRAALAQLRTQA